LSTNNEDEMLALYCRATRFVVCIVAPVTLVLTFFPGQIIYIWTGDATAANWTAPILPLFVLGNGLLAIGAFQYYLQYAHGKLKLHVQFNTALAVLSIPMITYAAFNYGPIGVGYVWLAFRLMSFLFWMPYVHKVFAPGLHKNWLLKDVLPPIGITALLLAMPVYLLEDHFPHDRFYGLLAIVGTTGLVTAITLLVSFNNEIRVYRHEKFQLR
jgi:O-antigen/teichoic acid export membrane protein